MTYNVKHTDTSKSPIAIENGIENTSQLDVSLFGRTKLEYGEQLNENLLHILESFSCPESQIEQGIPDSDLTFGTLLSNPTEGQKWYNTSQKRLFMWDSTKWVALGRRGDLASNWGRVCHGETLPRPVSSTGYIFPYDECIWAVSPVHYSNTFDHMTCATDENANVTMQYQLGTGTVGGLCNYLIIGIKGNTNSGVQVTPPSASPTGTPLPLPTPAPSVPLNPLVVTFVESQGFDSSIAGEVFTRPSFPTSGLRWPNGVSSPSPVTTSNIQPWQLQGSDGRGDAYYVEVPSSYSGTFNYAGSDIGLAPHTNDGSHKFIFISDDGINGRFYEVIDILWQGDGSQSDGIVVNGDFTKKWLRIKVDESGTDQHIAPTMAMFSASTNVYRVLDGTDTLNVNTIEERYDESPETERRYDIHITGGTPPYTVTDFQINDAALALGIPLSEDRLTQQGVTGTSLSGSLVPIAYDAGITNFAPTNEFTDLRPATIATMSGPVPTGDPIAGGYRVVDYVIVNSKFALHNWYFEQDCFTFSAQSISGTSALQCAGSTDISPSSDIATKRYTITVEDSAGVPQVATADLQTLVAFQTIDYQLTVVP